MSSVAAKVAPQSLHQFRNFSYIVVAWLGFNKGFREKRANDNAWIAHQAKVRHENVERFQAAHALREQQLDEQLERQIPAAIPEDLHKLYKELEKTVL